MGDRLGIPGAVSFCFSFTGQLTHTSPSFSIHAFSFTLLSDCCFFCLLTSLWLLSAFGVTKDSSASSFFISPPGGDRQAFFVTTWEMYPLRFQFNFKNSTTKQILKFTFFWCWWLVKNYLQVNKSNIQLFSVLCLVLGNRTEIHQLKKIQWITIK